MDLFITFYFSFAIGLWLGVWLNDNKNPWDVSIKSLLYGIVGALLWPILLLTLLDLRE